MNETSRPTAMLVQDSGLAASFGKLPTMVL